MNCSLDFLSQGLNQNFETYQKVMKISKLGTEEKEQKMDHSNQLGHINQNDDYSIHPNEGSAFCGECMSEQFKGPNYLYSNGEKHSKQNLSIQLPSNIQNIQFDYHQQPAIYNLSNNDISQQKMQPSSLFEQYYDQQLYEPEPESDSNQTRNKISNVQQLQDACEQQLINAQKQHEIILTSRHKNELQQSNQEKENQQLKEKTKLESVQIQRKLKKQERLKTQKSKWQSLPKRILRSSKQECALLSSDNQSSDHANNQNELVNGSNTSDSSRESNSINKNEGNLQNQSIYQYLEEEDLDLPQTHFQCQYFQEDQTSQKEEQINKNELNLHYINQSSTLRDNANNQIYQNQALLQKENNQINWEEIKMKRIQSLNNLDVINNLSVQAQQLQQFDQMIGEEEFLNSDDEDQHQVNNQIQNAPNKKNIVRNIMASFKRFISSAYDINHSGQKSYLFQKTKFEVYLNYQQNSQREESRRAILNTIIDLYNSNQNGNDPANIKNFLSIFKKYYDKKHFNHETLRQLVAHDGFGHIFKYYLENFFPNWIYNNQIANQQTHLEMKEKILLLFYSVNVSQHLQSFS